MHPHVTTRVKILKSAASVAHTRAGGPLSSCADYFSEKIMTEPENEAREETHPCETFILIIIATGQQLISSRSYHWERKPVHIVLLGFDSNSIPAEYAVVALQ